MCPNVFTPKSTFLFRKIIYNVIYWAFSICQDFYLFILINFNYVWGMCMCKWVQMSTEASGVGSHKNWLWAACCGYEESTWVLWKSPNVLLATEWAPLQPQCKYSKHVIIVNALKSRETKSVNVLAQATLIKNTMSWADWIIKIYFLKFWRMDI